MLRKLSKKDLGFDFKLPLISPRCLIGNYKLKGYISLHTTGGTKFLVKPICDTAPKSFFLSPSCVSGFEYGT